MTPGAVNEIEGRPWPLHFDSFYLPIEVPPASETMTSAPTSFEADLGRHVHPNVVRLVRYWLNLADEPRGALSIRTKTELCERDGGACRNRVRRAAAYRHAAFVTPVHSSAQIVASGS